MEKKIQKKCGNCLAYNRELGQCMVTVLHNGEKMNLPTEPEDDCFFEQEFEFVNENGKVEKFKVDIEQVRMWVEDPATGKPTDKNGVVRIEYPKNFFNK